MVYAGADGKPEYVERAVGHLKTAAGWFVTPESLYWRVKLLYNKWVSIILSGVKDIPN